MQQAVLSDIQQIVQSFSAQIVNLVEAATARRLQEAVAQALGAPVKRGPGRPRKNALPSFSFGSALATDAPRAKRPRQLCPVPGCKGVAAPIFGMVCKEHKAVSKAKIKKYRLARKAAAA